MEGGKPKTQVNIVSAYVVTSLALLMPVRGRTAFAFLINFLYNHVFATTRMVLYFLGRRLTRLMIFLTYFLVLGPTAILARILRRDYLSVSGDPQSFFQDKEPADQSAERFLRQF